MTGDLFSSAASAEGYASARPPVHPRVVDLAWRGAALPERVGLAVDVGCGAGLSTRPLVGRADHLLALDPAPAMIARASVLVPTASVVVAVAEALPLEDGPVDVATAAGSLDFAERRASRR